ncbi:MAG: outer membrane beta-barrel protein [Vulcanimicrobiaceae bacterium]
MDARRLLTLAVGATLVAVGGLRSPATAQTVPAPSPSPTAAPTPKPLVFDGYGDAGVTTVGGANSLKFVNGGNARVFDFATDKAVLQAVDLRLTDNQPLGGRVELSLGSDANVIAPFGMPNAANFNIMQAYANYTLGKLTLAGGKYVTLAGAESIRSIDDVNFSRSILFGYAVPFTHTGIRFTYAASSALSFVAGVNNGWDDFRDTNAQKTFEGAILYTPSAKFNLTAQGYSGVEQISNFPVSGSGGNRALIDIVATYKPADPTTLVLNIDAASQANAPLLNGAGTPVGTGSASWGGVAGYLTQQFSPKISGTLRLETFGDNGGYRTGFDQHWREGTVTLAYAPTAPLLFRGELRADNSNQPVFTNANGTGRTSLTTFGFEALYRF